MAICLLTNAMNTITLISERTQQTHTHRGRRWRERERRRRTWMQSNFHTHTHILWERERERARKWKGRMKHTNIGTQNVAVAVSGNKPHFIGFSGLFIIICQSWLPDCLFVMLNVHLFIGMKLTNVLFCAVQFVSALRHFQKLSVLFRQLM